MDDESHEFEVEKFIQEILAGLKAEEWTAEDVAEVERALASGEYGTPAWLAQLFPSPFSVPPFGNLAAFLDPKLEPPNRPPEKS